MKQLIRNACILTAITLVAGVVLSFVYELTKAPIAQAEMDAKTKAYAAVYKDADFKEIADGTALLEKVNAAYADGKHDQNGVTLARTTIDEVLTACDKSGNTVGYVMSVTSKNGYAGEIRAALGVTLDGEICGFTVLAHAETAGFGARCAEADYQATFTGDRSTDDVDVISGATYTTDALRELVGAALTFANDYGEGA